MNTLGILFSDIFGLVALAGIVHLVRRSLLTVGLGVVWILIITGLMLVITVAPLRHLWTSLSSMFFESPPYMIVLLIFLLIFLLYISVTISTMKKQIQEMAQSISLDRAADSTTQNKHKTQEK